MFLRGRHMQMRRVPAIRPLSAAAVIATMVASWAVVTTPAFAQSTKSPPTKSQSTKSPLILPSAPAGQAPSCVGGLPAPVPVRIGAGKSMMVNLPEPVVRRTLGNSRVVDARMVSPEVLYLVSNRVGSTNAILQGRSGRCTFLDIVVDLDTVAMRAKLADLLPNQKNIRVTAAADSVVLSGSVTDALAAERAVAIADAYVRAAYQPGADTRTGPGASAERPGRDGPGAGGAYSPRVINMLAVSSPQQVMLEVKIAEVSKQLLDRIGTQFAASRTSGSWTYSILSNFMSNTAGAGGAAAVKDALNRFAIEAEKGDGLVRILAEPTVMAVSGQEGSFLAGGRVLIPVAQSGGGNAGGVSLQEKEFGVGLRFTPTVLEDGRINLQVMPEVSELSREGVGINAGNGGFASLLPLITTRRASTTVQLFDGQSFAIGGLIKSNTATNIRAFPVLGEVPILGALFRSTDFQSERTELVFIVTPRLVKPLPPDYTLPTDLTGQPDRAAIVLEGRLDSPGATQRTALPKAVPQAGLMLD
jgi:pilus assembly protein CpaC